jgi:hypothetical protein
VGRAKTSWKLDGLSVQPSHSSVAPSPAFPRQLRTLLRSTIGLSLVDSHLQTFWNRKSGKGTATLVTIAIPHYYTHNHETT